MPLPQTTHPSLNRDAEATALSTLLDQLHSHLQEVRNNPSNILNQTLLENVDRQVTGMWHLIPMTVAESPS